MRALNVNLPRLMLELDRRVIYLLIAIVLSVPIVKNWSLPPAPMKTADAFFDSVEQLSSSSGKVVLISLDWGPGTQAENEPQSAVAIEHLMRKRIPFIITSLYTYASPFLEQLPRKVADKLHAEDTSEVWTYGRDWVNIGYQPNGILAIQKIATSSDLKADLKTDVYGTPLSNLEALQNVTNIHDISMLMEFTGLVGMFNYWLQFFQAANYRPSFVHGCTSITIPEAFIYFASKQIVGLHEGVAGAAWYEKRLSERYPKRTPGLAARNNTSLAYAHLALIALVILGNFGEYLRRRSVKRGTP